MAGSGIIKRLQGLRMAPSVRGSPVIGVDLGGTKILAALVDSENHILGRAKVPTPARQGADALRAALVAAAEQAVAEAGMTIDRVGAIGVGSPGPLDTEHGVILFSANLDVRDFPLGADLSQALGRPVLVRNDVRVGGYGEFRLGAGRGYRNVLAAFVGTGIGGCVVINGEVIQGATSNAGELGHITVKVNGPLCGCGRRGCLEALASRTAIARRIRKAVRKGATSPVAVELATKPDRLKSRELASAYATGDPVVVKEVLRAATILGQALGSLINVLGPDIVIIGGGVAEALGEPYLQPVRAAARAMALVDPDGKTRIELASLGDDAGILGAALMAREAFCT
jgi:glucokinase